ncbi:MAG: HNH endonuclease [Rhizobiaceae bacterium]
MDLQSETACQFYDDNYHMIFAHQWQRSEKLILGNKEDCFCRFCGKFAPEVTFHTVAHAVPEALGNRGLTSAYECDNCNQHFGRGIENHLGEWTKPMRTFSRIRGKNGIPTLKKGPENSWRIEHKENGFKIDSYETEPIFEMDEKNKHVTFTLKRGTYVPIAVLKAFVKIGLTLVPKDELSPFREALAWVREDDHKTSWVKESIVFHTMQNGPMPPELLVAYVLRRKAGIVNLPYAYLILGFGNDVYQVMLPAPSIDGTLSGKELKILPFPTPGGPNPVKYGKPKTKLLKMTATDPVKGETTKIRIGYENLSSTP